MPHSWQAHRSQFRVVSEPIQSPGEDPVTCVLAAFNGGLMSPVRTLSADETRTVLEDMRLLFRAHDEMQIMLLVMLNEQSFDAAFDGYVEEVRVQGGWGLGVRDMWRSILIVTS